MYDQAQTQPEAPQRLPAVQPRQYITVHDPVPLLDTAHFEQIQRVARVMAASSLIPDALCKYKEGEGPNAQVYDLPPEKVMANCFLVVNQAVRWHMDPFAVAQCCSVVRGKLMYEGKLIAAVLEARLGVRLDYTFDDKPGPQLGVVVSGVLPGETKPREIEGTVAQWSTGTSGPWAKEYNWKRQLRYRGAREWARAYAPSVILGVITDDEMEDLRDNMRANMAKPVESAQTVMIERLRGAAAAPTDMVGHVERETRPQTSTSPTTPEVEAPAQEGEPEASTLSTASDDAPGPAQPVAEALETSPAAEQPPAVETHPEPPQAQAGASEADAVPDAPWMADLSEAQLEMYERVSTGLQRLRKAVQWVKFKSAYAQEMRETVESMPQRAREHIESMMARKRQELGV